MIKNNSTGKPNFSQRLNPDDTTTPWNETLETCNVTSACTAMVTAGYDLAKYNKGLHERSAMDLLYFMRKNQRCVSMYNMIDPKHASPMNEWMPVLATAIEEYLDIHAAPLVFGCAEVSIKAHIDAGDGMVIHGYYQFIRKDGVSLVGSGHFQSLCGYVQEDTGNKVISSFIVDDPFGDPNTHYVSQAGDNVLISRKMWQEQVKPYGVGGKDVIIIPKAV